ncbi:hypothetical protein [Cryobacterium sp. 10I5]|uniref:hypothetical protein n=1 Tax=Cryobacterium sp. 10I5 TaxID=3048581 RepID=UPI002B224FF8|nr:hypothetical protein [Cryobacterium sp. 10I5]MEB0265490.1 hypothetical protein [Cryobacterium sp. 10I5]
MPTTRSAKDLSIFNITTDADEQIMFVRHNGSARSAASVSSDSPYEQCIGVSFELGETGKLNWLSGRGHTTAGLVINVEQIYDLEFEQMP